MGKYVIMEVEDGFRDDENGLKHLRPTDGKILGEFMWLDPSRILEGTWRRGGPKDGEMFLTMESPFPKIRRAIYSFDEERWILDPPAVEAPPVPEWEQEVRDILTPVISLDRVDRFIGALRKWKEGGE